MVVRCSDACAGACRGFGAELMSMAGSRDVLRDRLGRAGLERYADALVALAAPSVRLHGREAVSRPPSAPRHIAVPVPTIESAIAIGSSTGHVSRYWQTVRSAVGATTWLGNSATVRTCRGPRRWWCAISWTLVRLRSAVLTRSR